MQKCKLYLDIISQVTMIREKCFECKKASCKLGFISLGFNIIKCKEC